MSHNFPAFAKNIADAGPTGPTYSFCTLVSQPHMYAQMLESFVAAGFTAADCEYLYIDNSTTNQGDGFRGLNRLITQASGKFVVLCHQDLLAIDPRSVLDACLADLDRVAPDWAVAGNSGHNRRGMRVERLTDRHGYGTSLGKLPGQVVSLDENFLLIRRAAGLGLSDDLAGFHLYGTDLVTQAGLRGRSAWVISFHLEHLGLGRLDAGFATSLAAFSRKYRRAFRKRRVTTPTVALQLGGLDLAARFRAYKLQRTKDGKKPFAVARAATRWVKALPFVLHEWRNGPRYAVDGTVFTIPDKSPLAARKALRRGQYEGPERRMITKWLPKTLPVIELGGSYGIVSHAIRRHIAPDLDLIIVEANPDLLATCRANVALAGMPAERTQVIGAALAYGAQTVRFAVTSGIHTSHVAGADEGLTGQRIVEVPVANLTGLLRDAKITGDYALVCDIEGAEYDLLHNDSAMLARCAVMIMEIHPDTFIDRGSSVTEFLRMLNAAGFDIVDHEAQVIVARRR